MANYIKQTITFEKLEPINVLHFSLINKSSKLLLIHFLYDSSFTGQIVSALAVVHAVYGLLPFKCLKHTHYTVKLLLSGPFTLTCLQIIYAVFPP